MRGYANLAITWTVHFLLGSLRGTSVTASVPAGGIVRPPPVLTPGVQMTGVVPHQVLPEGFVPQTVHVQPQPEFRRTHYPDVRTPTPDFSPVIPRQSHLQQAQGIPVVPDPNFYPNPNNYNSRSKLMCTSLLLRMKRRVLFRDSLNRAKGVRRTLLHESPPSLPPKCRKVPRDRLSRLFPLNLYPWSSPPSSSSGAYEPRVGSPRQPDAPRTQPLKAPPALPPAPIAPTAPAAHPPIIVQPLPPSVSQVVERRLASTRPPRSPVPQREELSHGEPATIVVRTHSPERSPCRPTSMGPYPGGQLQMPHPVPPSVPVIVQRTRSRTRLPSPIIIHSDRGRSPSIDRDGRRRRPRSPTGVVEGDPHRCSPSPTVLHRRSRPTMRRIFSQMSLEVASHSKREYDEGLRAEPHLLQNMKRVKDLRINLGSVYRARNENMKVTACPRQRALTHRNDIPAVLDHRALNANVNLTVFHQVQVIENRAGALQVQLWFMLTNPNPKSDLVDGLVKSAVTLRRYSRATPEVSARRLVYEEADRPTPGITRVSTQRTARTARTEPIAPPVKEEEEDIPHISVVIHSVEHVPTASRPRAGIPSVAVVPPEEAEEPYLPEELPAEPGKTFDSQTQNANVRNGLGNSSNSLLKLYWDLGKQFLQNTLEETKAETAPARHSAKMAVNAAAGSKRSEWCIRCCRCVQLSSMGKNARQMQAVQRREAREVEEARCKGKMTCGGWTDAVSEAGDQPVTMQLARELLSPTARDDVDWTKQEQALVHCSVRLLCFIFTSLLTRNTYSMSDAGVDPHHPINPRSGYHPLAYNDPEPSSAHEQSTPGIYNLEAVDYDYAHPPPGSPPGPSDRALPNEYGNSNDLVSAGTDDARRRGGWLRRSAAAILPSYYVEKFELSPHAPAGTIGGGTSNDRVFVNDTGWYAGDFSPLFAQAVCKCPFDD
ncbi:hypothetical protein BKA93DRAFT_745503 [Sparassis latifolia]